MNEAQFWAVCAVLFAVVWLYSTVKEVPHSGLLGAAVFGLLSTMACGVIAAAIVGIGYLVYRAFL